ncbi:uncharacterized protein EV420DRAFT_1482210 [Desarmillaria tabescens]|uniref:Uncharacterized protein n=1 Tax=Armillaria tabescens TaxID=1929756 RepID=A0AA39K0H9_ARMTA|nr:uncharacterized protein EV420DRAFT_1482210 [Desarmillaria tabescens]KAK0452123.1 hypothetical protein EV420DRAFT_1482210 [Desarmillaria tabescens]
MSAQMVAWERLDVVVRKQELIGSQFGMVLLLTITSPYLDALLPPICPVQSIAGIPRVSAIFIDGELARRQIRVRSWLWGDTTCPHIYAYRAIRLRQVSYTYHESLRTTGLTAIATQIANWQNDGFMSLPRFSWIRASALLWINEADFRAFRMLHICYGVEHVERQTIHDRKGSRSCMSVVSARISTAYILSHQSDVWTSTVFRYEHLPNPDSIHDFPGYQMPSRGLDWRRVPFMLRLVCHRWNQKFKKIKRVAGGSDVLAAVIELIYLTVYRGSSVRTHLDACAQCLFEISHISIISQPRQANVRITV